LKLLKGLLLKPVLNLLEWILRRDSNSLIIGGPLGWTWQSTLDTTHHGALAGPANAHRHSDLANIDIDDHHARDHATRHQLGGADQVNLDASQIGSGRFGMSRMPDGTLGEVLTAQGAGADPTYAAVSAPVTVSEDIAISNTLRNSNDTAKSTSSTSYVKIKEVLLNAALARCRIKFDLRVTTGAGENTALAKIYKNGAAIGTEQSNTSTTYVTKSQDFVSLNAVAGDLIQIYARKISGDSAASQVRYMRFYYDPDDKITHIGGYELVTPLDLTPVRDPTIPMTNQDP